MGARKAVAFTSCRRLRAWYLFLLGHPARKAGAELHGRLDPRRLFTGPAGAAMDRLAVNS